MQDLDSRQHEVIVAVQSNLLLLTSMEPGTDSTLTRDRIGHPSSLLRHPHTSTSRGPDLQASWPLTLDASPG